MTPDSSRNDATAPDLSGRQLGDFQLLLQLGHGAMAEVYLAEQKRLKRRVAVKVLKPEFARDATYLQRFAREAQAAAALVHANIVQIYEVGRQGDVHYIAQEYVEGQNLREWLSRHGPPDLPRALSIMCQASAALAKAGDHGVVHRDIKPENILLTRDGQLKIADFGLARFASDNDLSNLTQVGMTMGTPLYMSPEQVEGKPLDPRSDIYSFGVTCYHLLAGQPPFSGETALGVAVQHLKNEAKPLESIRGDLPPALCRIVHAMLVKSPSQRYANARAVLRDLRRVQTQFCGENWPEDLPGWDSGLADIGPHSQTAATQQLAALMATQANARRTSRSRWLIGAGLLAALLVGGLLGHWAFAARPLLQDASAAHSPIRKQSSVTRQWYYASQIGTPEAWQSVIDHFGDNGLYVVRAKQQKALAYLEQKDYGRALSLFDELAASGPSDPDLQAFGLAGQYVVHTVRDETAAADRALKELWDRRKDLKNPQMSELLSSFRKKGRFAAPEGQKWDKWLEEQTRPPG